MNNNPLKKCMNKFLALLFIFLTSIPVMIAKDDDEGKRGKMLQEVREFKMNYLAKEMELTEAQKEKFMPLYEEMTQKKDECFRHARELDRKLKKEGSEATEEDYQKATEAMHKANQDFAEIEKEYNEKFSEFLSQKQLYKMKEAEFSFRDRLEEMRHNRKKHPEKGKKEKK